MSFSQRNGYKPALKLVQFESIDDELRSSLWSVTQLIIWDTYSSPYNDYGRPLGSVRGSNFETFTNQLWVNHFKVPVDTIPAEWTNCLYKIREMYFAYNWHETLDFVEFVSGIADEKVSLQYIEACNHCFNEENSAYRFIAGQVAPIANEEEADEVVAAIGLQSRFAGSSEHLRTALSMLSDKQNPDYRNSIKESISAVESVAKSITGDEKATLGKLLSKLESEKGLHQALRQSFSAMYGYTSDADGIRHAMMDVPSIQKSDARYMLITCSAFINFMGESLE